MDSAPAVGTRRVPTTFRRPARCGSSDGKTMVAPDCVRMFTYPMNRLARFQARFLGHLWESSRQSEMSSGGSVFSAGGRISGRKWSVDEVRPETGISERGNNGEITPLALCPGSSLRRRPWPRLRRVLASAFRQAISSRRLATRSTICRCTASEGNGNWRSQVIAIDGSKVRCELSRARKWFLAGALLMYVDVQADNALPIVNAFYLYNSDRSREQTNLIARPQRGGGSPRRELRSRP